MQQAARAHRDSVAAPAKKRRVLLLADSCNPDWPSLPIVGYKYAKALAEITDAVVVTQIRNQPNIERDGLGKAKVVYLDTERVAAPIAKLAIALRGHENKAWTLQMAMDYPSYLYFERQAFKTFKRELASGQFDLVHRITPMTPTLPSPFARRSPVPFVIGPLNGNLPWPLHFATERSREREWLSKLRGAYKLMPYYRSTYQHSRAILAAFDHTVADVDPRHLGKTINVPEVGIDPELFSAPTRPLKDQCTVLYAGRLVPYKLPEVVVRAFATNPALRRHRLLIVGDGPERPRLEALVREHGLQDVVSLLGQKTQKEVGQLMRECEIFAFPSIRELGAGVVVEAMACGMACVVVDYGGPATLVGPDRGVKVPMSNLESLTQGFAAELARLAANPELTKTLGDAAHEHAMRYYTWERKAALTSDIYEWLLGNRAKPDFWRD